MIKKLLSIALVAGALSVNAQQLTPGKAYYKNANLSSRTNAPASTYSVTIDTLMPASTMAGGCAVGTNTAVNGFVYYGINRNPANHNDSGYYFGTGIFPQAGLNVTGLAQRYKVGGTAATVSSVLVWAGKASGSITTTTATILSEMAGNGPGAMIGTASAPLTMASYVASLTSTVSPYATYTFTTPVPLTANENFFASISIPGFGGTDHDTLAVLDTRLGCSSVDTLSWINIPAAGGWHSVLSGFGSNLDLMIFPVLDISSSVGINNYVSHGGLSIFAASPNPANNSININFSLNNPSKVEIEVYDISGKVVKSIKNNESFASGKSYISVDVSNLEAGTYMYSINANGNKMFSKFMVTK
jgi:hypothetical protein